MNSGPVGNTECAPMATGSMSKRQSENPEEEEPLRKIPKVSRASSETERTKLHDAVAFSLFCPNAVHAILQSEQNIIDVQDEYGRTALHIATELGMESIVKALLAEGASTNLQDIEGMTPLHSIVSGKHRWGVDEDEEDEELKSFQLSLSEGYIRTMKELIAIGADVLLRDECDRTPLHLALRWRNKAAAEVLVDAKSGNNLQDEDGQTPLHLAAEAGYVEIVKKLLAAGVSTRVRDFYGRTPLQVALKCGNYSAANILVDADGENNLFDELGLSPLHHAVKEKKVQIAKKLLFCGAHPHIKVDPYPALKMKGIFPLEIALKEGHDVIAQIILLACALRDIVINWEDLDLKLRDTVMYSAEFGLHVFGRVELSPYQKQRYPNLFVEFCLEVQKMKHTKLTGTTVSYYDFARKHERNLALYLKNKDIQATLRSTNIKELFPNYGPLITFKVKRARKRNTLTARCLKCFSVLSKKIPALLKMNIDTILHCLSERDMQNFIKAFNLKS